MAGFPSRSKGNVRGEKALQPRPGIPLVDSLSKESVLALIREHSGNLGHIADVVGTTRGALRRLCDNNEELKTALSDSRERALDNLESSVWSRAINSADTSLQTFLLKSQGRERGYDTHEDRNAAKDIATAAFDFIISKSASKA